MIINLFDGNRTNQDSITEYQDGDELEGEQKHADNEDYAHYRDYRQVLLSGIDDRLKSLENDSMIIGMAKQEGIKLPTNVVLRRHFSFSEEYPAFIEQAELYFTPDELGPLKRKLEEVRKQFYPIMVVNNE